MVQASSTPGPSTVPNVPCISLRDVDMVYRSQGKPDFLAVKNINFDIQEQELFALVGPTGCGKSTILLCISGLLFPTGGNVEIRGGPVGEAKSSNQFGFIFQDPVLLPWRTAIDNVRLPLEVTGTYEGNQEKRCQEQSDAEY